MHQVKGIQFTLKRWSQEVAPFKIVSKENASAYEEVIINVHASIVHSTHEPKEMRSGTSLYLGAQEILAAFELTQDPFYQAAIIYDVIAHKGHYFIEGNKRTAYCMAKAHLLSNKYHFIVNYKYAIPFIEHIAQGKKSVGEIREWLSRFSCKYYRKTREKYLKQLIKEMTKDEKRGRPVKDGGKKFQ